MKRRLALRLIAATLVALPAFAHGGGLIIAFVGVAWGVPALVALLGPWGGWRMRLTISVVPVAIAAAGLAALFQTGTDRWSSPVGDILLSAVVFGPAASIAVVLAIVYVTKRRRAA